MLEARGRIGGVRGILRAFEALPRSLTGALEEGVGCVGGYSEHRRWYPKDGELYLVRTKPGETLVEVRRGSDVQIDRLNWV